MEIASTQEDPIPISTSYGLSGGGQENMIHLLHHHHGSSAPSKPLIVSSNGNGLGKNHDHHVGYNVMSCNKTMRKEKPLVIKYKECLKNHAASMGGNAVDGCGEFMPSVEEGSIEALICSACSCHRNFHRREIEGEERAFFSPYIHHHQPHRELMFHHHHNKMIKSPLPQQMIMPIGVATSNSESEDLMEEEGGGNLSFRKPPLPQGPQPPYRYGHDQKKRFRTKFTQEQKEKMLTFAEKAEWKIQKYDESVVQQFCQEIGVRRRVLKVWMHNNKQNLTKKTNNVDEVSAGNNDNTNAAENLVSTSP